MMMKSKKSGGYSPKYGVSPGPLKKVIAAEEEMPASACGIKYRDLAEGESRPRVCRWVNEQWLLPGFLSLAPDDARLPWYRGDAAMVFEGDWMEAVIKTDEQDIANFDFFLAPTGHTPLRFSAFPEQIMIASASPHKDPRQNFAVGRIDDVERLAGLGPLAVDEVPEHALVFAEPCAGGLIRFGCGPVLHRFENLGDCRHQGIGWR